MGVPKASLFLLCVRHVHYLLGGSPELELQYLSLAKSKGVHCEVESEGSRRQIFEPRTETLYEAGLSG